MYNYKDLTKKYDVDFAKAIYKRKSKRTFNDLPLKREDEEILNTEILEINRETGLKIQLAEDKPEALNPIKGSYGLLTGVRHAILLIGKDDEDDAERCGYYGEILTLLCVDRGMDTCWVGGSVNKDKLNLDIDDGDVIHALIAVGSSAEHSFKDSVIDKIMGFKEKNRENIVEGNLHNMPSWFKEGLDVANMAPSSLNQKPVIYSYVELEAHVKLSSKQRYSYLDLGISKLHFEIGADCGKWTLGDEASFEFEK